MTDDMSENDREPAAWLAFADDGSSALYMTDAEAQAAAEAWGWKVAPLYLAPTLTDAEREAIDFAAWAVGRDAAFREQHASELRETLEQLLERLK